MKSILMSIQPKWVKKIISGEKIIEVRKTAPKEVPFAERLIIGTARCWNVYKEMF